MPISSYESMEPHENTVDTLLMHKPAAIVIFVFGVLGGVLTIAGAAYALVHRRRIRQPNELTKCDVQRALNLPATGGLFDDARSYTQSWSGSSGIGEGTGSSRRLTVPEKPLLTSGSTTDIVVGSLPSSGTTVLGPGRLQFSVSYVSAVQELLVSVLRCTDLPASDLVLGTVDSYVKLELLPERQHKVKTRVVRNTQNPFFGEAFTFNRVSISQVRSMTLHFFIVGFDRHSRDSLIGEVICPLVDLQLNIVREITIAKEICKRKFSPTDRSRGSLLVSLCYLPAANRMTVVVLKAERLPKVDLADTAGNPYVKIYFMDDGNRIIKKKTHVKKRTSSPVFNEAFALEIPLHAKLENIYLDFRIVNWDREAPSKVIGHVSIGCNGDEVAKKQWKTAIENPRRQVAEWHTIIA